MYPAQTSLMPIQIALTKFWEFQGPSAFFANYPYWYLGTTPFRFLTGPILPSFLVALHKIFPSLSLFTIYYLLLTICWVIGGIGVYLLVREIGSTSSSSAGLRGALAAFFYLLGPIVPFLFRFSDGLYLIAFSFLPFILLKYLRFLKAPKRKVVLIFLIAFIILFDAQIIPTLVFGMAAILLAQTGWKKVEEKLRQTFVIFIFSILLSSFWYTPGYWWTLLGAPSFGGQGLVQVIAWLGKLLPVVLALTLAVVSGKFFKGKNLLRDFTFYWLFIFGFLTLIRFLSDPDFWLDWSSYGVELQMGIALGLGLLLEGRLRKTEDGTGRRMTEVRSKISHQFSVFRNLSSVFSFQSSVIFAFYILLFTFVLNRYVLGTLQKDITQTVEYQVGQKLSQIAKPNDRVFLSGTTAFWFNAFFDIPQIRGGVDQASVDPDWRKGVWEIRQGDDPEKSLLWLQKWKVRYLVVHTEDSREFYHDFADPQKFENLAGLEKIDEINGDRFYQVE